MAIDLISLELAGGPAQVLAAAIDRPTAAGLVGVDVAAATIDGHATTVVQLLLDDDHPGFDATLLDAPLVAELRTHGHGPDASPVVLALEPLDHDAFRRRLAQEQADGASTTRGVLVRTGGQLPPPHVRLAFLPLEIAATAGTCLTVRRTTVAELVAGIEAAFARGEVTDDERRAVLVGIEQRHPTPSA
ncbi:MAG: hypothetical protein KDA97_07565 [Acidimicrobiales bacterium]|nr:hypothetical protein [Acidimicrobiales bacterium]